MLHWLAKNEVNFFDRRLQLQLVWMTQWICRIQELAVVTCLAQVDYIQFDWRLWSCEKQFLMNMVYCRMLFTFFSETLVLCHTKSILTNLWESS